MNASPDAGSGETASPACDLRFGQVGLANVRVLADRPAQLQYELARRVAASPAMFRRTAVVLDLGHMTTIPPVDHVAALLKAVRDAGMLPVGLAYGDPRLEALAEAVDLPLIARFREAYEHAREDAPRPAAPQASAPATIPAEQTAGTLFNDQQVRGGQQLYAPGGDLVVTATVANGAEVIADGSIHVYGSLRGRALAGARGNDDARIFCSDFRAQLISIAGQYRVFEQLPEQLAGQAVQCWLENDKLRIETLQDHPK